MNNRRNFRSISPPPGNATKLLKIVKAPGRPSPAIRTFLHHNESARIPSHYDALSTQLERYTGAFVSAVRIQLGGQSAPRSTQSYPVSSVQNTKPKRFFQRILRNSGRIPDSRKKLKKMKKRLHSDFDSGKFGFAVTQRHSLVGLIVE